MHVCVVYVLSYVAHNQIENEETKKNVHKTVKIWFFISVQAVGAVELFYFSFAKIACFESCDTFGESWGDKLGLRLFNKLPHFPSSNLSMLV